LLVQYMQAELGHCYPLHLGVTEAGDGEDGRIKSAIGIGTLLEEGIGDTIRVSLTEDPEFEIPVCKNIIKRYAYNETQPSGKHTTVPQTNAAGAALHSTNGTATSIQHAAISEAPGGAFSPLKEMAGVRPVFEVSNIGNRHVPVVIADYS